MKRCVYPWGVSPKAHHGDCIYAGHRDVPGAFICPEDGKQTLQGAGADAVQRAVLDMQLLARYYPLCFYFSLLK